jgi:hypothetical protein
MTLKELKEKYRTTKNRKRIWKLYNILENKDLSNKKKAELIKTIS